MLLAFSLTSTQDIFNTSECICINASGTNSVISFIAVLIPRHFFVASTEQNCQQRKVFAFFMRIYLLRVSNTLKIMSTDRNALAHSRPYEILWFEEKRRREQS